MKKVCVVTGGTGGIGLATVKKMCEDYIVLFCDINQEKLDKVDTLGPMNINESFYEVMGENSCIIDICSSTSHFIPKDRWPYDLFKLSQEDKQAFYDKFVEFIETISSPENNMWANMAYTWARCFIYWYGQQCCYKYGREKGIRVNLVSPGIVATEDSMKSTSGGTSDTMRFTMSWTPLGRTGRVEEIAFLFWSMIDERNSYLTGVEIPFDGGAVANGFHGQREEFVQA